MKVRIVGYLENTYQGFYFLWSTLEISVQQSQNVLPGEATYGKPPSEKPIFRVPRPAYRTISHRYLD